MRLKINQLRKLIREEIENLGYNKSMATKKIGHKYLVNQEHITLYNEKGQSYKLTQNSTITITGEPELLTIHYFNGESDQRKVYPVSIVSGVVTLPNYSPEDLQVLFPERHNPKISEQVFDVVDGFIPTNESQSLKRI